MTEDVCRVGLRYMLDLWSGCWQSHQADIENGEIGLSQALLANGYNIASMQHEYTGLDFRRQPDKLQCKGRLGNPTFCCESPGEPHICHTSAVQVQVGSVKAWPYFCCENASKVCQNMATLLL